MHTHMPTGEAANLSYMLCIGEYENLEVYYIFCSRIVYIVMIGSLVLCVRF